MDEPIDYLKHYGVPGMRWGHRKGKVSSSPESRHPVEVSVTGKPGGKIQTSGGQNLMPHPDAKIAAGYRQQARTSGSSTLSNAQLRALLERTKLETEYSKIRQAEIEAAKSPIRKFIDKFIEDEKKRAMSGNKPKTVDLVESIISDVQKQKVAKTGKAAKVAMP